MTPEQKADLRFTARAYLAERHPATFTARQMVRPLGQELDFAVTAADIEAVLIYLEGLEQVSHSVGELGPVKLWRATTAGVQAHERGDA